MWLVSLVHSIKITKKIKENIHNNFNSFPKPIVALLQHPWTVFIKFLKKVESLFINIVIQCIRCCNALGWGVCQTKHCLLNKKILWRFNIIFKLPSTLFWPTFTFRFYIFVKKTQYNKILWRWIGIQITPEIKSANIYFNRLTKTSNSHTLTSL